MIKGFVSEEYHKYLMVWWSPKATRACVRAVPLVPMQPYIRLRHRADVSS